MRKNGGVIIEFVDPVRLPDGTSEQRAFAPSVAVATHIADTLFGWCSRRVKDGEFLLYSEEGTKLVATITKLAL